MDKLQRKINKEMKNHQQSFDDWYKQHQVTLSRFDGQISEVSNGNTAVKVRKVWVPVVSFLLLVVVCLSIVLPIVLSNGNNDFDLTFSEGDVYTMELSDSEFEVACNEYKFIRNMEITSKDGLYLKSDKSLVMAVLGGEIVSEDNYYLLDLQIEYSKNYNFGYKPIYEDLDNSARTGEWSITYENTSVDLSGLYVYLLRMVNQEGQVIYIETHCLENDISYILNEFIF